MNHAVLTVSDAAWEDVLNNIAYLVALSIIALVGLLANRKLKKVGRRVDSIDGAVNSRPPEDPKLYDLAHTNGMQGAVIDRKLDELRVTVMSGFQQVNTRADGLDQRITDLDRRATTEVRRATEATREAVEATAKLHKRLDKAGLPGAD